MLFDRRGALRRLLVTWPREHHGPGPRRDLGNRGKCSTGLLHLIQDKDPWEGQWGFLDLFQVISVSLSLMRDKSSGAHILEILIWDIRDQGLCCVVLFLLHLLCFTFCNWQHSLIFFIYMFHPILGLHFHLGFLDLMGPKSSFPGDSTQCRMSLLKWDGLCLPKWQRIWVATLWGCPSTSHHVVCQCSNTT